jgi:hypothetical protein
MKMKLMLALSLIVLALQTLIQSQAFASGIPAMTIDADQGDWLPGTTKHFHLEWTNLNIGDPYQVIVTDTFGMFGENYAFIVASGTILSQNGSMDLDVGFPTTSESYSMDYPAIPQDGQHIALFYDVAMDTRAWSQQFQLILAQVHLSSFALKPITAYLDEAFRPLEVYVDATYSPSDVVSVTLPLLVYTTSPDDVLQVALFDGDRQVSNVQVIKADPYGKNFFSLETHGFSVPKGTGKYLSLRVIAKKGFGSISCAIYFENQMSAFGPHGQSLSTAVGWWGGPEVTLIGPKRQ